MYCTENIHTPTMELLVYRKNHCTDGTYRDKILPTMHLCLPQHRTLGRCMTLKLCTVTVSTVVLGIYRDGTGCPALSVYIRKS